MKQHLLSAATIFGACALCFVIIMGTLAMMQPIKTASVTGDIRTGWTYHTMPDQMSQLPERCLPGTDVLVAISDGTVVGASNSTCLANSTLFGRSTSVEGDVRYALTGPLMIYYDCDPASSGIGSGVMRIMASGELILVSSKACEPL